MYESHSLCNVCKYGYKTHTFSGIEGSTCRNPKISRN